MYYTFLELKLEEVMPLMMVKDCAKATILSSYRHPSASDLINISIVLRHRRYDLSLCHQLRDSVVGVSNVDDSRWCLVS